MALSVKIESFEGPLDLLLHLIDVNKFNIFDIPIVEITDHYMEYLDSMDKRIREVRETKKQQVKDQTISSYDIEFDQVSFSYVHHTEVP